MTAWVTAEYAADLADAHLTTILRQAKMGRLAYRRTRSTRHAGKEITEVAVDSLPPKAQERWQQQRRLPGRPLLTPAHQNPAAELAPAREPADDRPGGLSADKLAWSSFRYRIIEPLATSQWMATFPTREACLASICGREHRAPNSKLKRYSPAGIYRMLRRFRESGLAGLANETRSDRGAPRRLTQPMQDFIAAAYLSGGSPQHPGRRSVREVCRLVDEERAKRDELHRRGELLAYIAAGFRSWEGEPAEFYLFGAAGAGAIGRFVGSIPEPMKVMARAGAKAYKAQCEPYILRDYSSLAPMDWVVFDHRVCDIFVLFRKLGKLILMRPWETVAIDVRSRLVLASVMCEQPSALSVSSCVRQIILRFGLFRNAYLDNGKEFTAAYIDGAGYREGEAYVQDLSSPDFDAARGIFGQLGVSVTHAEPFNARAKLIEPSFRNPAYFERTLAGGCGSKAQHRPDYLAAWEKEFKRWDPSQSANHPFHSYEEFRRFKAHFYDQDYANRKHTGRGMNGRSPAQVMREEFLDRGLARMVSPRALDLLLQKRRTRTVQQGGTLVATFAGADHVYTHPALFPLQGVEVETAYDPFDLGEMVVYRPGGDFVCAAASQRLYGMGEAAIEEPIKERRRIAREMRRSLKALHSYAALPTAAERIEWSEALAAARGETPPSADPAPNTPLPQRYELAAGAMAGARSALGPAPAAASEDITFLGTV